MGKIPRISFKLNFSPNTLGCYGLISLIIPLFHSENHGLLRCILYQNRRIQFMKYNFFVPLRHAPQLDSSLNPPLITG